MSFANNPTELVEEYNNSSSIISIDKDKIYQSWISKKIFTIEFYQTLEDRDEQVNKINHLLCEFPSIRKFECHYDYSANLKGVSRHHYHGILYTSSFSKLFAKYGANKKGIKKKDHDLLIWMTNIDEDKLKCWTFYCNMFKKGLPKHKASKKISF